MPKIVDHKERQREIVAAYLGLVARDGFEGATTRALTKLLGVSTGSLWNYFESQTELVTEAFRLTFEAQNARLAGVAETLQGLDALAAFIREVLPLTEAGRHEARISIEFWHKGIQFHPQFHTVQGTSEGYWKSLMARFLQEALDEGDLRPNLEPATLADVLVVVIEGLQLEFMMDAELGSPQQMERVSLASISAWLTEQGAARLSAIQGRPLMQTS